MNTPDQQFEMTQYVDDDSSKPVGGVDKYKELPVDTPLAEPDIDIVEKNYVKKLENYEQVVKTSSRMGDKNSSAKHDNKKKVWTKTKTGLYGWKSVKAASTSAEIGKTPTKIRSVKVNNTSKISASADGGPRSQVCARETLRSAPHRH